jgi:tetratricopeptide (TPR) repeat protein
MKHPTDLPADCREAFELAMGTEWKSEAARERALSDAVETFEEALAREPANQKLWMHLGELQLDRGASREARRAFRQALRLEPNDALAHSGMAYACSELGRHVEAERLLRRALELDPSELLYGQLAALLIAQDRVEEAEQPLRAGLSLDPENPELLFLFARYLAEDAGEAQRTLERALNADPDNVEALFELGALFAGEGEFERAAACYRRATELDPGSAEAWRELAAVQLDQEQGASLELAQKAVELDPEDARSLGILAEALLRAERGSEAEEVLARAVANRPLDPDVARAHWLQARLFEERGLVDEALVALYEAEACAPSWPAIAADLGRLNLEQGELELADRYLQIALEHDQEDAQSRELLRALQAR